MGTWALFKELLKRGKHSKVKDVEIWSMYQRCFSTDTGRRVLEHLFATCHGATSTYIPGDSHATAYNEGKRDVLLFILQTLNAEIENER